MQPTCLPLKPLHIRLLYSAAESHAAQALNNIRSGHFQKGLRDFERAARLQESAMDMAWSMATTWPKESA
jgi:hypothetical protein